MTAHAFAFNPGSVTQGTCSCGDWDGHVDNHHTHARTKNGHNVKQPVDYLTEAKGAAANMSYEPATAYALIAIAEALQANSAANLAAAVGAGALATVDAVASIADITMTGHS
ncbi:MAG: hypothetical protein K2Y33_03300 [Mycolicibacterium frederiksbergense]|nr:hypothetical protein [Mycolicibacterium frederiksbergense]